ncbi:MAG: prephenate dehydratase [Chloroflexota bacterium]
MSKPTVAFQGEHGAYGEAAVLKFFGDAELVPCARLSDVFDAVLQDRVEYGVVPVENSQAGSINETYDLLLSYPLGIYGEVNLRVSHCLMALPGTKLKDVKKAYSHPQALAQCAEFLRRLNVEVVPVYNTAGGAKLISEAKMADAAAIASRQAAEIYGLEVLRENIETSPANYTKFLVISTKKAKRQDKNKTSLVLVTKNTPGALYGCLGAFANRNINMLKLESRPRKDNPWEYVFYVDFEGHIEDEGTQQALKELETKTAFVKILGCYPQAQS